MGPITSGPVPVHLEQCQGVIIRHRRYVRGLWLCIPQDDPAAQKTLTTRSLKETSQHASRVSLSEKDVR